MNMCVSKRVGSQFISSYIYTLTYNIPLVDVRSLHFIAAEQ